jgi:Icc-related predicted phosphoesterase
MRVAHISDTHDNHRLIDGVAELDVDVILITGDCIPNRGRVNFQRIDTKAELKYQGRKLRKLAKRWAEAIGDTPVIVIRGNHDFIHYGREFARYGIDVHEITDTKPMIELLGKRWAGFRQVNYIIGEWAGEERDLEPFIDRAMACNPDILVTHAPPGNILDTDSHGEKGYGIDRLTQVLTYSEHRITHHFFGHAHNSGGKVVEEMGIKFINGAGFCRIHTID